MKSINPATGDILSRYEAHDEETVAAIVTDTALAWERWRYVAMDERARLLRRLAAALRARKEELGARATQEMGKLRREAEAEVEKCAWVCEYYAEHAAAMLADEPVTTDDRPNAQGWITYRPLGVVLAIMPWNFPFWQLFRFAAPALMAGNAVLLKHASNVCGCALAIEALCRDAGLPPHLLSSLLIGSERVEALIRHPVIRAVTLTGSTQAGRAVAATAGAALKKTVLELGGSDPYLILDDAPLAQTVEACVTGRLINAGQSCIAAKRFIVTPGIYERFLAAFTERMRTVRMGDPAEAASGIGPLASVALRDALHAQLARSVKSGARCILGGEIPDGPGAYYPPTVLTEVTPGMPAFDEELFGPVAAVIRAEHEADAIRLANASAYGLGGAVFTADLARGHRIARDALDSGTLAVNGFVQSDPRLPFGGVKDSGYGRELSQAGIREFVNAKSMVLYEPLYGKKGSP